MTFLSPSFIRGLSVLAIGGGLAVAHVTFASAAPAGGSRPEMTTTGSVGDGEVLGENCWIELVRETTASGRTVTRRVQECD